MLKDVFQNVSAQLKTNISWVKSVDMYFNQDTNPEKSIGYKSPYILLDFQNIRYENMSNSLQQCTLDLVVKLIIENYDRNQLKVLDYRQDLVQCLYNYNPEQFSLKHTGEKTDSNATNQYCNEITFECNFYEDFSYVYDYIGGTSGHAYNFNLQLVIDGNGDETFTSWSSATGGVTWTGAMINNSSYLEQVFTNQISVTVTHNWNTKPVVTIIDTDGKIINIIDTDLNVTETVVQYLNDNIIVVTFEAPTTGTIILQRAGNAPLITSANTVNHLEQAFINQTSVIVNHNWNTKPVVTITDEDGNILNDEILGLVHVNYENDNSILVTFNSPSSGKIILQR